MATERTKLVSEEVRVESGAGCSDIQETPPYVKKLLLEAYQEMQKGNYGRERELLIEALQFLDENHGREKYTKHRDIVLSLYVRIGWCSLVLQRYEDAIEYYNRALRIIKKTKETRR
jgi:tetratricopeptide (TPR) repeat protein